MTTETIQKAMTYAEEHKDTFLEGFKEFLRIPSVGTDPAFADGIKAGAEFVLKELERIGLEHCAVMPTARHPVVYGDWLHAGDDKPTILIYAHYDVQPPDPLDLWETGPFDPVVKEGQLLARGAADDKSGVWGNLKVFESLFETSGKLPLNVKVMFEGEEEMGSPSIKEYLLQNKELLKADLLIISDGGHNPGQPINAYSTRGLVAVEVIATGPEVDMHSGNGGLIENPIHALSRIIVSLHDEHGNVNIPGGHDGVIPMTDSEFEAFTSEREQEDVDISRKMVGHFELWGDESYTLTERSTARPSIDINGIYGGYQGDGVKTIIPSKAGCKITMRLAPGQNPHDQLENLIQHLMSFDSRTVKIEVIPHQIFAWPSLTLFEGPVIDAFRRACEGLWEKPARMERAGGTLPLIGTFQQELGIQVTFMPMNVGARVHAPNEYVELDSLHTCIVSAIRFYSYLGELDEIS